MEDGRYLKKVGRGGEEDCCIASLIHSLHTDRQLGQGLGMKSPHPAIQTLQDPALFTPDILAAPQNQVSAQTLGAQLPSDPFLRNHLSAPCTISSMYTKPLQSLSTFDGHSADFWEFKAIFEDCCCINRWMAEELVIGTWLCMSLRRTGRGVIVSYQELYSAPMSKLDTRYGGGLMCQTFL